METIAERQVRGSDGPGQGGVGYNWTPLGASFTSVTSRSKMLKEAVLVYLTDNLNMVIAPFSRGTRDKMKDTEER